MMGTQRRRRGNPRQKYNSFLCTNKMTFQECELAILRNAVDESEKIKGEQIAKSAEITEIIDILEDYLVKKRFICYGGTAINNILPNYAQFYNRNVELPDYDFFSTNAMRDAKHLADIYYKAGYADVEAKAGVHFGTYKVYVNFIPIADITQMHPRLYAELEKECITIKGIRYAPPNYLRMSMFLELSRPQGDTSRWEKVLKRMNLLNKHYPLNKPHCEKIDFQRKLDDEKTPTDQEKYYYYARDSFIEQGLVFFGGYAAALYSHYMPHEQQKQLEKIPDFDVLSETPKESAEKVKKSFLENGVKDVKIIRHESLGEVIPEHYELRVGNDTLAFIYQPIACHSYNTIHEDGKEVKVATIDTMLSFYLAFMYADREYFLKDRILCLAMYLFEVEQKNRLEQKGLLRRFTLTCYGKQPTLEEIRAEKARMYAELGGIKGQNTRQFDLWFLKYSPGKQGSSLRKTAKKQKMANAKLKHGKALTDTSLANLIKPNAFLPAMF